MMLVMVLARGYVTLWSLCRRCVVELNFIFIPSHMIVVGYYGFCVSVCLSVSCTSILYIDIMAIWFEIVNGQILSNIELSARNTPTFSFPDNNF